MSELQDVNSLDETADYLGVSVTVLRRMARDRKIGFLRIGRSYVFPREVIRAYVEENTIKQLHRTRTASLTGHYATSNEAAVTSRFVVCENGLHPEARVGKQRPPGRRGR